MKSSFQFSNPVLTDFVLCLNEGFDNQGNKEVQIKMSMSVDVSKHETAKEALVGLTFEIGEKNDNTPFYIKATEKANFRWDEEIDEKMVDILLNQNAPSLLLSYLRPIVAQITAASPYEAYDIPFINFTKNK